MRSESYKPFLESFMQYVATNHSEKVYVVVKALVKLDYQSICMLKQEHRQKVESLLLSFIFEQIEAGMILEAAKVLLKYQTAIDPDDS